MEAGIIDIAAKLEQFFILNTFFVSLFLVPFRYTIHCHLSGDVNDY